MEQIIKEAIVQKRLIDFDYKELHRITEPHILGVCNGIIQVLVYQIDGKSNSGRLPGWRRINIYEVFNLKILDERFMGKRSLPSGNYSSWDYHLAVVE